jgi:hypothetical protein
LILFIVFVPCTVVPLQELHLGLAKNKVTGVVDLNTTHTPGRYWIGVWREFISVPSYLCTIEFSDEAPEEGVQPLSRLRARDMEGKLMFLDVSVQYRLIPEEMGQLYREMTVLYEDVYISELRDRLSKACNRFRALEIWQNYEEVNERMFQECIDVLKPRHAVCWGLQIWGIELNKRYEDQLIRTQVRKQAQRTELARLDASKVRATTAVLIAGYNRKIAEIDAGGWKQSYNITRRAQNLAAANLTMAEADVLDFFREEVVTLDAAPMTPAQLKRYRMATMIHHHDQAHLVYHATATDPTMKAANVAASQTIMDRR